MNTTVDVIPAEQGFNGTWNSHTTATFDNDSKPKCPLKWLQCLNHSVDNT